MSDLEKKLIELRNKIDTEEPASGHMERFRKRLMPERKKSRAVNFRYALQIAASLAIIMASGVVIVKSSKGGNKIAAAPAVEEFQEARNFYAVQVNERYENLEAIPFDSDQEKEILLKELSEMDGYYKELLDELNANPGDERVMNALLQHYQIKLQVMDQIIGQLEQFKTKNNYENENTEI